MPQFRLEHRLPIAVSLLLALLFGGATWLAYREVRNAAVAAAKDRIDSTAEQFAQTAALTLANRAAVLARAASEPAILELLRGDTASLPAARLVLDPIRGIDEPATMFAIVRRGEEPILPLDTIEGADVPDWAALRARRSDGVALDGFGVLGDLRYFWVAVPFDDSAESPFFAQLRFLGGSPAGIEELVGTGARILFRDEHGPESFIFGGPAGEDPPTAEAAFPARDYTRGGVRYLASIRRIEGTPWLMILEVPFATVLQRATRFLERVLLFGALFIVGGAVAVGLLIRRSLRPLRELEAAALDIASGSYERRVRIEADDEIGELATAFNAMAVQVGLAIEQAGESREQALDASRAKSAFLATMSHEIRTPINAVIGYTELLEMGVAGPINDEQRAYLGRVRQSSEHLMQLVDEVLDLSKIEAGELRVDLAPCPASDAVKLACAVLLPQSRLRRVEIARETSDVWCVADSQRLEQILVNLISNAVKFSESGGRVTVRAGVATPPPSVGGEAAMCRFEIEDAGCGIPTELHESIFEPFVQGDTGYTRSQGGAGLGLAISRHLARRMRGEITVVSTPGRGSTFSLWLPHAAVPAEPLVIAGARTPLDEGEADPLD